MDRLIEKLPDDIVIKIYTKHLRKYRLHNGEFIKLIDFEQYKFLEKVLSRRIVSVSKVKTYDENSGRVLPNNILRIEYILPNFCELPDRKEQLIDDDMMYVYLNIKEDTISYTIKQFRLKKIEEFLLKNKPYSMYHRGNYPRGNYQDYDWEVFTLSSDGSTQDA